MTVQNEHRKIIHIDMDAFYASVEQLDNSELKGKPIAVGGNEVRGVVSAASYEARKYGVRSAMPGALAKRMCPTLIFVPLRFERYKQISKQINSIFLEYTDLVEPLSLDEAFLDVTTNKKAFESATKLAEEIRNRIFQETGLTASAGISINKFVAKIASDYNKPNGQYTVPPDQVESFLEKQPIENFFGIGKVTAAKMNELGIRKGIDLKRKELRFLTQFFGNQGLHYYNIVRGIHNSEVKPNRIRKSYATEHTFSEDLYTKRQMMEKLVILSKELEDGLQKRVIKGRTLTLKVKFSDFTQQTKSKTSDTFLYTQHDFMLFVEELLLNFDMEKPVRLLGLSLSKLNTDENNKIQYKQLTLNF